MENQIVQAIYPLLSVIVTVIIGFVGKQAAAFIKSKHMGHVANIAVAYVEETFQSIDGKDKFQEAVKYFVNKLAKVGIKNIDDKEVEAQIQAAYNQLKNDLEQNDIADPAPVDPQPELPVDTPVNPVAPVAPVIDPNQSVANLKVSDLHQVIRDAVNQ